MKRSIILVAIAAALGLSACTSTPTPAPDTTATSSSAPSSATPPPAVVTTVVTQTVTNPPPPPAKPVIGSFGYGDLKLGMTRQQALDAKLIGPALEGGQPADSCTLHEITGTKQRTWVSKKLGVASITFSPEMTSDGVGIGATEEKLKAEYTNIRPTGPNYTWVADADDNPAARFVFGVDKEKKTLWAAYLALNEQDCHN
ncbi:hypothetical protein AB0E59_39775 [Lentzea sp. NPDC034063]|uniref:hypothetical protein n=1 Tax=unclassified Lentzea TaxID=2643253 RepID=UPI0033CEEEF1